MFRLLVRITLCCEEFIMSAMMPHYSKTGFYFMIAAMHFTTSTNIPQSPLSLRQTHFSLETPNPTHSNAKTSAPSHLDPASPVINRSIKNHMNSWQSISARTNSDLTKKKLPHPNLSSPTCSLNLKLGLLSHNPT